MTRFLSRVWDDPKCGGFNQDTERLFAYHQATKHSYHSVRTNARYLDWHNQPDPFRTYEGVPAILLPAEPGFPDVGSFAVMAALAENAKLPAKDTSGSHEKIQLDLIWLSRLLWHSMAVSAWKKVPGSGGRYSLRVNPSSGNLHPTETYVALRAFAGMDDGYITTARTVHALELRSRGGWTQQLASALEIPWARSRADGRADFHFLARSLEIRGSCVSLLLPRFGPRDDERAAGCERFGTARRNGGSFQRPTACSRARLTESDEAPMAFLVFPARENFDGLRGPMRPCKRWREIRTSFPRKRFAIEMLLGIHAATILPDARDPLPRVVSVSRLGHERSSRTILKITEALSRCAVLGEPCDGDARRSISILEHSPWTAGGLEQLLDFATRDWSCGLARKF